MKRVLLTVVILLLTFQVVGALEEIDPYEITIEEVKDQIPAGGEAEFYITVKNNVNKPEVVQLAANDLDLFPFSDFARAVVIEPPLVNLGHGDEETFKIRIRSLDDAATNKNHVTRINIKSLTSQYDSSVNLNTFVFSDEDLVQIVVKTPEVLVPGEMNEVKVLFKNRGDVEFEDLEFYIQSEVWNENEIVSFKPNEEKEIIYDAELASGVKSGEYVLSSRLYKGKELKGDSKTDVRVGRNPDLKEKEEADEGFLVTDLKITSRNDGNVPVTSSFDYKVGFIERLFTSVEPEADYIDGRYVWAFTVQPGTDNVINVTTDYRPGLIGLVVLSALFGIVVYFLSRGVKVRKRVFKIRNSHSGNEVKVMLHVKNKDSKEVHNVKVVDLIPSLIKPTGNYSTIMPDRVQQGPRGMRLIWTIETLAPGEERVISYNAASDMQMLGPVGIPPASVQYINRKAKFVINKSNSVSFKS